MTQTAIKVPDYVTMVEPRKPRLMRDLPDVLNQMFTEDYSLPEPQLVSMYAAAPSISLQFGHEPDTFHAMARWAEQFGGTLTGQRCTGPGNGQRIRCQVTFTYNGVSVELYAYVQTGQDTEGNADD
jgi:hypothetical protein